MAGKSVHHPALSDMLVLSGIGSQERQLFLAPRRHRTTVPLKVREAAQFVLARGSTDVGGQLDENQATVPALAPQLQAVDLDLNCPFQPTGQPTHIRKILPATPTTGTSLFCRSARSVKHSDRLQDRCGWLGRFRCRGAAAALRNAVRDKEHAQVSVGKQIFEQAGQRGQGRATTGSLRLELSLLIVTLTKETLAMIGMSRRSRLASAAVAQTPVIQTL